MGGLRSGFEHELATITGRVGELGDFVRRMAADAVTAVVEGRLELAEDVIRRDDIADEMDLAIETAAVRCIALQQPVARDLRLLATALKVISDLERIGDYAVDIAKAAPSVSGGVPASYHELIRSMGDATDKMTAEAVAALLHGDVALAESVGLADDRVDAIWKELRAELIAELQSDPTSAPWAVSLLLVARHLERVGDHATNVAERVGYIESGELRQLSRKHRP